MKNGIFPAIPVNKDVTVSVIAALQLELVSPKGTQGGEYLSSQSISQGETRDVEMLSPGLEVLKFPDE